MSSRALTKDDISFLECGDSSPLWDYATKRVRSQSGDEWPHSKEKRCRGETNISSGYRIDVSARHLHDYGSATTGWQHRHRQSSGPGDHSGSIGPGPFRVDHDDAVRKDLRGVVECAQLARHSSSST